MILSADTNLFLYAANPDAPQHAAARRFFAEQAEWPRPESPFIGSNPP